MTDQKNMHPDDKKNLIIFIVVAIGIWFVFETFLLKPRIEAMRAHDQATRLEETQQTSLGQIDPVALDRNSSAVLESYDRADVTGQGQRIYFENKNIFGSINLTGGRIDDLSLKNHYETLEKDENIHLLSPAKTEYPRYVDMGWISKDSTMKMPDAKSVWRVQGNDQLGAGQTVKLIWNNGQGLLFERIFKLDDKFVFSVEQNVINGTDSPVNLYPYRLISQKGLPRHFLGQWIIHEGPIGYINDELTEISFKKIRKKGGQAIKADHGWIAITDQYWLTSLLPQDTEEADQKFRFVYSGPGKKDKSPESWKKGLYQVDVTGAEKTIPSKGMFSSKFHVFSGPKELNTIQDYEKTLGVKHFDLVIDFGMYYFLTKPFFMILSFIASLVGNYGVAIIIMTFMLRLAVFPLANKSYRSFANLRKISPQMKEIREKHKDDKQGMQKALVKLYEKEKVNPVAGCFPILIQIPIFFGLYKTLRISIEMRHAPFFGWIKDLSAPDPLTVFNGFGLLDFNVPGVLDHFGPWAILMLCFMLLQRQLNPPPQDPTQAMLANYMPFVMTFILAKFAAGLVIYWAVSNGLSVLQQYVLMRMMGVEVHLFKRFKGDKEMAEMVKDGPDVHPELGYVEDHVEKALFDDPLEIEEDDNKTAPPAKKKSKTALGKKSGKSKAKPKAKPKGKPKG